MLMLKTIIKVFTYFGDINIDFNHFIFKLHINIVFTKSRTFTI